MLCSLLQLFTLFYLQHLMSCSIQLFTTGPQCPFISSEINVIRNHLGETNNNTFRYNKFRIQIDTDYGERQREILQHLYVNGIDINVQSQLYSTVSKQNVCFV